MPSRKNHASGESQAMPVLPFPVSFQAIEQQVATAPTEQQTLQALEQLKQALNIVEQLRQHLDLMRGSGFSLLPQSRRLKIQPLYRETFEEPYHIASCLHLAGDWLQACGFKHGHHARVITLHQLLIICPETLPAPKGQGAP